MDNEPYKIAIADGATESSFAAEWAGILTKDYVKSSYSSLKDLQQHISELSRQWNVFLDTKELPWYAEEKVKSGAFSTIWGIELKCDQNTSSGTGFWSASAVGDSCLFQIRENTLQCSFPLGKSLDFNNSPTLISSNPERNERVWSEISYQSGKWKSGDIFLLLTDALAAWFLKQCELGQYPWNELREFSDKKNTRFFGKWIDAKRKESVLKIDDVTCIIVKV